MKHTLGLTALLMLATAAQTASAADAAAGKWKAQTCLGCHGVPSYATVYPTYYVPRLGGQHAEYIVAALQAYKSGERNHETMAAQAHRLSESDMADIAAYFAAFESAPPNLEAQPPAELQELVATCSACHGNDGNGPLALYPKLAGQHQDYLYQSLLSYKAGKRTNIIMAGIVTILDEENMEALSEYFAGHSGLGEIELGITSE